MSDSFHTLLAILAWLFLLYRLHSLVFPACS
jgi:hypothetical protein